MKKIITILISFLVLAVIALTFAGDYFYNEAVKRGTATELHREDEAIPVMVDRENERLIEEATEWYENQTFETLTMTSYDDLLLEGHFLEQENSADKTVLLAHGFRNERENMADFVQFYYDQGFDVFIPDLRGHGESEGDYIGFGWHDRLDLKQWTEQLIEEKNSSSIFLHGVSMGAATVLMTSGEELPSQVNGIIADSGYTSAEDILTYQLEHLYNLPSFPIMQVTSGLTQARAGFGFTEASAVDQVAKNNVPLFIIHGEADELVPESMSHQLYDAASGDKTLWTVPEAGHVKAYTVATTEYQQRLTDFIEENIEE
ncbi:alpha/beta hydrolase [Salipaludibacillus daqingensis]|uniref:alpha/beta hydrolase n=1 Tax=Salipaludibacillus daqingensis TaxID=3041001 RepID=UPI002473295A|nr:alpha/beta fold hydrolase [Salipaludibacillus daqingensis]